MKIRQISTVLQMLALLMSMMAFGCVQQMKTVQGDTPIESDSLSAQIQKISVSDDGASLEIISSKPIVYTYYTLENPGRVIVDLAQTAADQQKPSAEINKGAVKRIDISKHEFGSGVLSRLEVSLTGKADVVAALDQQDKRRLVLTFATQASAAAQNSEQVADLKPAESQAAVQKSAELKPAESQAVSVKPVAEASQPVTSEKASVQAPAENKPVSSAEPVPAEIQKQAAASPVIAVENISEKKVQGDQSSAAQIPVSEPPVKQVEPVETPKAELPKSSNITQQNGSPEVEKKADVPQAKPTTAASKVVAKPDDRLLTAIVKTQDSLQLEITGAVPGYKTFRLSQPERIVIDIQKTKNALASKTVKIDAFGLGNARVGGTPDNLRVVLDLVSGTTPPYTVSKNSSGIILNFGEAVAQKTKAEPVAVDDKIAAPTATTVEQASVKDSAPVTPAAVETQVAAAKPEPKGSSAENAPSVKQSKSPVKPVVGNVEAIEFSQADGKSFITLRSSGGCSAGVPVKTNRGLVMSLRDCRIPAKLQRQLDTTGFESAISGIAPFNAKGKAPEARLAVNFKGNLVNSVKRESTAVVWEFVEPVKAPAQIRSKTAAKQSSSSQPQKTAPVAVVPVPSVEREFVDQKQDQSKPATVKSKEDVFQLDKTAQAPLRAGKTYTGRKVTLEFSDAEVRKIFQLLAEVSNKNFLVSDDVSGTITLKLVNVPWDQALDVILENKGLGMQLDGNIVQIRPKTKMKSLDDEAIEMRLTEEKRMPLSTVIFDINFATLSDIETQFKNLKSKRTDSSISSDMRTNKIIVVDIDPNIRKMRALLESLDVPEKQVMIEARIVEASSNFARDLGVKWNFGYQDGSASVANINNITGAMGGVVTNVLPTGTTGGIAAGMSFGKLLSNIQLDMRLSAASTVGQVKIISTPKVLTVNNKAAKISQGQMIPYQNTSSADGAKTEFIEAALSLEVTPHITADGSVNMKIKASNNTAGVGSPPPINKKEATTELVVKNGETTVIGGIYVDSETEGDTGVPYLSDIPLLGWLFKSNSKLKTKNEMLIFITPKIMN